MAAAAIWSVPAAFVVAAAPAVARVALLLRRGGSMDNRAPRDRAGQVKGLSPSDAALAARLLAAHHNQLETLGYFAGGVAVAVAARVPPPELSRLAGAYVAARVAYVTAYAAPQVAHGAVRTATFFAAMASIWMLYGAAAREVAANY